MKSKREQLQEALGAQFNVPETDMKFDALDLSQPEPTNDMPTLDLSQKEPDASIEPRFAGLQKAGFKVPGEQKMPAVDLTKTMDMPAMDLRSRVVQGGSTDVSKEDLDTAALKSFIDGPHTYGDGRTFGGAHHVNAGSVDVPAPHVAHGPIQNPDEIDRAEAVGMRKYDPVNDDHGLWLVQLRDKERAAQRPDAGMEPAATFARQQPKEDVEHMARGASRFGVLAAKANPKPLSPAHGKAKQLLAGIKSTRNYPGLTEADINDVGNHDGDHPAPTTGDVALGPEAPSSQPAPEVARSPLRQAVAATTMGATPPTAQPPGDGALKAAQAAASHSADRAGLIDQLNSATDSIAGTHFAAGHDGDAVRAHGKQGVQDVLTRDDRQMAHEDQSFQRDANTRAGSADQRAGAAEQRAQTTFQAGREMDTPGNRQAKAYEAVAAGLYPDKVKGIPPEARAGMSANDWKAALGELQQQQPVGAGGGAGGARGQAQLSKLLPPETANVYAATQRIKQLVNKAGGWDKVQGVGMLGGLTPGFMMDETGGALRQEIGNVAGIYLQSKGGKAITSHEEKIILERIAANPKGSTPQQLQQAMTIIERNVAANARQSLGAVPTDQANQILDNSGVPHEWARQDATAPTRTAPAPAKKLVRLKSGEVVEQAD